MSFRYITFSDTILILVEVGMEISILHNCLIWFEHDSRLLVFYIFNLRNS